MAEFRQLLHFVEIAKQNSFRGAAKKLNLSQSALSRSIQRLEDVLGAPLFNRGSRQVTLTVFGEALLPRAASIINSLNDANHLMADLKGLEAGEIRVGYGPVYAELIAARSIAKFNTNFPKVKIYTELGRFTELIEYLDSGKTDLLIGEVSTLAHMKKYSFVPLKKRDVVYCCRPNHPIFKVKSIDSNIVAEYPIVTCQLPFRLLPHISKPDKEVHTDKHTFAYSDIVCDSFAVCKQICIQSDAICLIPRILITSELGMRELRIIDFKHKPVSTQAGIVHLAERYPSPAIEKYIETVRELDEQL